MRRRIATFSTEEAEVERNIKSVAEGEKGMPLDNRKNKM